jgi:antitoxin HigA-1
MINGVSAFASATAMLSMLRSPTIIEDKHMPVAIHPGEYLREILGELEVSQSAFADTIGVSSMRISHVINGARPVTAELALLFGKALGQSPEYWLNLQIAFDLASARNAVSPRLKRVRPLSVVHRTA